jgi:maltooligosyltrehalose synthase
VLFENAGHSWREVLTGAKYRIDAEIALADLFRELPVAVLQLAAKTE